MIDLYALYFPLCTKKSHTHKVALKSLSCRVPLTIKFISRNKYTKKNFFFFKQNSTFKIKKMIATTYQHDYVSPVTKRYDFANRMEQSEKATACQCTTDQRIEVPKTLQKQSNVEWTGIAPMGRLIYPRNIPTNFSNEQLDVMLNETPNDCHEKQPNRFLKVLPTAYPLLYDRLKQMPVDELNRRLDSDRMFTTYQIDFCDIYEHPEGIYNLKAEDGTRKLKSTNEAVEGPNNATTNDSCEKLYKPFKLSFVDSSRFISSGNNSHWRSNFFVKKAKFSEYMDTISKLGCAITKNNIHDHQKCNKTNCRHKLVHGCMNLK